MSRLPRGTRWRGACEDTGQGARSSVVIVPDGAARADHRPRRPAPGAISDKEEVNMSVRKIVAIGGIVSLVCIVPAASAGRPTKPPKDQPKPKNVIVMIADGMGPEYERAAKAMDLFRGGDGMLAVESLDSDPVLVTTHSLRIVNGEIIERVTDSAASATAIATGFKTRNGGMSVDLDCATIRCCDAETETCAGELRTALEAAEAMGKATGIVSNVNVQDATPGVWAAHWHTRSGRPIASQQVNAGLEVLLGSGRWYMVPQGTQGGGSRTDGRNTIQEMVDLGYTFVETRDQLDAVVDPGPVGLLGIFGSIETTTYVLDRFQDPDLSHSPTVVQMVEKAMDVLDGRSNNGFFLVIEGAYPDFLGHNLDLPGLVAETLEFNEALQAVLDRFGGDGETLIVATADHETGGLVLEGDPACEERRPENCDPYNLAFVDSVECTTDFMHGQVMKQGWDGAAIVSACFPQGGVTEEEVDAAIEDCANSEIGISRLMASKAGVEFFQTTAHADPWDTCDGGSHTLTRVNVYVDGPGAELFDGITDNTHIGQALHRAVCGTWPCN